MTTEPVGEPPFELTAGSGYMPYVTLLEPLFNEGEPNATAWDWYDVKDPFMYESHGLFDLLSLAPSRSDLEFGFPAWFRP